MQIKRTLGFGLLLLLVSCLSMDSCQANGVGQRQTQRRVQTSATTTTGARQLSGLGLDVGQFPLFHATYATNDEYIETPLRPLRQRQFQLKQQQLKAKDAVVDADADANADAGLGVVDQMHFAELTPGQLQQLAGGKDEKGRHFHSKQPIILIINQTPTTAAPTTAPTTAATTTTTAAPATTTTTAPVAGLYFKGLQSLNDLHHNQFGYNPYNVPLVPVSLGNNAVGYMPLNLRMFRHLVDGAPFAPTAAQLPPIRESEDDALPPLEERPLDNAESEVAEAFDEAAGNSGSNTASEKLPSISVPPLFTKNFRPRPVLSLANNLRHVQYL
ncbi:hypothetical protein ACLKA6_015398 [Drosophila palustris]